MFTFDTCTNLITHLVSYVALIINVKYVPLIRVHTRISIVLFVYPCHIVCKITLLVGEKLCRVM